MAKSKVKVSKVSNSKRSLANRLSYRRRLLKAKYKDLFGDKVVEDLHFYNHLEFKHMGSGNIVPHVTPLGQRMLTASVMVASMVDSFQFALMTGYIPPPSLLNSIMNNDSPHVPADGSPELFSELTTPMKITSDNNIPITPSSSSISSPPQLDSQHNYQSFVDILGAPLIDDKSFVTENITHEVSVEKVGHYSRIFRGWGLKRPHVMYAAKQIVKEQMAHEFNSPKGCNISIDAPFGEKANAPTANVDCRKVFRNYHGRVLEDGSLACYGTCTGAYTVGIPPNQFVNKPFNQHIDVISHYILHTMQNHPDYANNDDIVKVLPNHMTSLHFYHKRQEKSEDEQLAYHCDCLWDDDGKWLPKKNSQQMNTPTFSLTVGDSRTLKMKKWRKGTGKSGDKSLYEVELVLQHGDLFILDPRDEKMMLRPGDAFPTKFKHGAVKVKKSDGDLLSIGLIFRSVTAKAFFDSETSKFVITPEFWNGLTEEKKNEYLRRDAILDIYTKSGQLKDSYLRLKHIFDGMLTRHFHSI